MTFHLKNRLFQLIPVLHQIDEYILIAGVQSTDLLINQTFGPFSCITIILIFSKTSGSIQINSRKDTLDSLLAYATGKSKSGKVGNHVQGILHVFKYGLVYFC